MGIFYNPPPPPTGSTSATPPDRHVPIGTQGSQPPRFSSAIMLVAVLASWPQDLEPRLTRPNDQQQKIAPLTLPYGQQPANVGTSIASEYTLIAGQWPADLEPRLSGPNNRRQTVAPLTLTYGAQPPIVGTAAIAEAVAIGSWPADLEPRLGSPNNAQQHIAPLTLTYGNPPPLIGTNVPELYHIAVSAWPADLEPRLTGPNNARVRVAPLTLTYGSQPTPTSALNTPEFQAISAWPQPDWLAQAAPKSTAWIAPPASVPYVAFPYGLVLASWPLDLEPRLTRPNDHRQKIAPLTLPTGAQPQPQAPISLPELITIVSAWPTAWEAQTAPKNAAWNVPPILTQAPYAPLPRAIWTAWEPPWIAPPKPVAIVTLTLPTGQTPPAGPSATLRLILAWPLDAPVVPRVSAVAALIPPVVGQVPYTALPTLIWTAWGDLFLRPQTLVAIAPLTLPSGQAPPLITTARATLAALLSATWPADLEPRLGLPNSTQQKIAPLTRVYGSQPAPRAPLVVSTWHIVSTWAQTWDAQASPRIATLTLPRGQQPPVRERFDRQITARAEWRDPFVLPQRLRTVQPPNPIVTTLDEFVIVAAADRWFEVSADGRFITVPPGQRFAVDAEGRFVIVPPQDRTFDGDGE